MTYIIGTISLALINAQFQSLRIFFVYLPHVPICLVTFSPANLSACHLERLSEFLL